MQAPPRGPRSTVKLGDINNPVSNAPQSPSQTDIQAAVADGLVSSSTFDVTRFLYNVYNNSTATSQAGPANQATLNLVSEYGFMCKPGTVADYDPLTGVNYRTEIEANIKTQGFFPLDTSDLHPFLEGSVNAPAVITDSFYTDVDPTTGTLAGKGPGSATSGTGNGIPIGETNSASNPYGFCLSTTANEQSRLPHGRSKQQQHGSPKGCSSEGVRPQPDPLFVSVGLSGTMASSTSTQRRVSEWHGRFGRVASISPRWVPPRSPALPEGPTEGVDRAGRGTRHPGGSGGALIGAVRLAPRRRPSSEGYDPGGRRACPWVGVRIDPILGGPTMSAGAE